jgi:hypothetical protein
MHCYSLPATGESKPFSLSGRHRSAGKNTGEDRPGRIEGAYTEKVRANEREIMLIYNLLIAEDRSKSLSLHFLYEWVQERKVAHGKGFIRKART